LNLITIVPLSMGLTYHICVMLIDMTIVW